ncbi:MAG: bifunctional phosphoribosyl-AMP cyclohydrolase/phosphoribosyl-ATP diphosphatase HisIE [Bacillota bacterium]
MRESEKPSVPKDLSVPDDLWANLSPGRDGLVPAIIQDHSTGQVLMLGYQDREAFDRSLATGDVWFHSRGRGVLWHKGETSGHFLRMKARPRVDCDADALLYVVDPVGPTCHTGEMSCFFRVIGEGGLEPAEAWASQTGPVTSGGGGPSGPASVPERLAAIISQRRVAAEPEKSYTARLFATGLDKMLKKVGEEATEVVLAAKNGDRANLIWELADLYFHAAVVMEQLGVTREDVLTELARRFPAGTTVEPEHGRPGRR